MDTLEIEAFLAVVHHGSLTDAANSLFLSQSTLSHRIVQLERRVGMNLISRGRGFRTLTLTSNGQEFLPIARRWMDLIREINEVRSRKKKLKLSIGAIDSVQNYILPPIYQALSSYSQDIVIRIKTLSSSELYQQLDRGEIDIAFGHFEQPMPNMIIKKFSNEQMVVISKGELISANGKLIDKKLDTSNQLYYGWNISFQSWYDRWLGEREYPPITVDTASLLLTFMNAPEKWAIVPLSMARYFEATGEFNIYHLEDTPPERICYQIRLRNPKEITVESLKILDSCINSVSNERNMLEYLTL